MRTRKALRNVVLSLAAVALLTILLWPREKLLLAQAQRLSLSSEQYPNEPGAWISANTQLLLETMPDGRHYGVFSRDMTTGNTTPLTAFNTAYAMLLLRNQAASRSQPAMMQRSWPPPHAFSPDRKWLLWQTRLGKKSTWIAASLDGKQIGEWDNTPRNGFKQGVHYWMGDGRHWALLGYDPEFYLHRISIFSLDDPKSRVDKTFASRGSRWPIGITPDNHLLTYEPSIAPPTPSLTFYDTPLDDSPPSSRKIVVPLPPGTRANSLKLSPDGARLLWSVHTSPQLPGPAWIQTLCRKLGMKPRAQDALWVSRRDGSGLHEIGHLALDPPAPVPTRPNMPSAQFQAWLNDLPRIYDVQWLPDNKHVIFLYKEGAYKVPAD